MKKDLLLKLPINWIDARKELPPKGEKVLVKCVKCWCAYDNEIADAIYDGRIISTTHDYPLFWKYYEYGYVHSVAVSVWAREKEFVYEKK